MKANKRKLLSILAISFVIALSLSFVGIGLQGKEVYANSGLSTLAELKQDIATEGRQYQRVYRENGDVETYELPLSEAFVDYFAAELTETPQTRAPSTVNTFPVTTLVDSGLSDEDSIVVVFMGDGYTAGTGANQQGSWPNPAEGSFLAQANKAAQTLLSTHPFNLFSHLFNIYAIQVPSLESGITGSPDGTGADRETYFDVYFEKQGSIRMPDNKQVQALQG